MKEYLEGQVITEVKIKHYIISLKVGRTIWYDLVLPPCFHFFRKMLLWVIPKLHIIVVFSSYLRVVWRKISNGAMNTNCIAVF